MIIAFLIIARVIAIKRSMQKIIPENEAKKKNHCSTPSKQRILLQF